jgi:hypothetical protein
MMAMLAAFDYGLVVLLVSLSVLACLLPGVRRVCSRGEIPESEKCTMEEALEILQGTRLGTESALLKYSRGGMLVRRWLTAGKFRFYRDEIVSLREELPLRVRKTG